MSSLYASPLLQQCHVLFPIQGEVYGHILHCRILEICDKVLNSFFLSGTCDSALSRIFFLRVTLPSFLTPHAFSPLLNTSWPLNLMPWCSLSCTLSPSFLRALSPGFLAHHFSHIYSFSQIVLLFPIPFLTAPLSCGLALSPPSHDLIPSFTTLFSLSPACTLTFCTCLLFLEQSVFYIPFLPHSSSLCYSHSLLLMPPLLLPCVCWVFFFACHIFPAHSISHILSSFFSHSLSCFSHMCTFLQPCLCLLVLLCTLPFSSTCPFS